MTEVNAMTIAALRKTLASLDMKKKSLESEGEAIISELTSKTDGGGEPMGMNTPLVDRDGYPRSDIDIFRARTLRRRLAEIKTDRSTMLVDIEKKLQKLAMLNSPVLQKNIEDEQAARLRPKPKPKYDSKSRKWVAMNWDGTVAGIKGGEHISFHNIVDSETKLEDIAQQLAQQSIDNRTENASELQATQAEEESQIPFAKLNSVAPNSPAGDAGLKEGDEIVKFGSINVANHRNLQAVAEMVPEVASNSRTIELIVLRGDANNNSKIRKHCMLRPRPWAGRGLLGCHIVPSVN